MKALHEISVQQINALARAQGYIEIRALQRQADDSMKPCGSKYIHVNSSITGLDSALSWADQQQQRECEIFISANLRSCQGGKKQDVQLLTACYTDLDLHGERIDSALEALYAAPIRPNMIVHSGYGLHPYWLIAPHTDKVLWQRVQKGLQVYFAAFGADSAVATDEARVLRLAPYPNLKHGQCISTEIVYQDSSASTAQLEELAKIYGHHAEPRPQHDRTTLDPRYGVLPRRTLQYLAFGAIEGSRNVELYAAAQQYNAAGYPQDEAERVLLPRAMADGLRADEAQRAVESGYQSSQVTAAIEVGGHFIPDAAVYSGTASIDEHSEEAQLAPTVVVPALPAYAAVDTDLAATASPWLDTYISFSRQWSPESYDGFHEAIGLWVLSTVAARRVAVDYGKAQFANLYIALCARSTVYAKSTAAEIGRDVLEACGLSYLLAPDDATPQAFLQSLTLRVPEGFADVDELRQTAIQRKLAFAAQRGWFYDEFGQKLHAMMQSSGSMVEYRGHLRRLDDCPPTYEYATVGRGSDWIERPYLALLASLTPADLQPHARKGAALWGDGFLARFALISPPADLQIPCRSFPDGRRIIPANLVHPLRAWHEWLGIPDVSIIERLNDKGEGTGYFSATVEAPAMRRCSLEAGVKNAVEVYRRALREIRQAAETDNSDLDGNYGRLHIKALRIAMLLASLENEGQIDLRHWARAQEIAERWRADLHHLVAQLGSGESTKARALEDRILERLAQGKQTARTLKQYTHASYTEVEAVLAVLNRHKQVQAIKTPQTTYYQLVSTNDRGVDPNTAATGATPATATPEPANEIEGVAGVACSSCSTDEKACSASSAQVDNSPPDQCNDIARIDLDYVRCLWEAGNEQAIRVHCALRRVSYADAIQAITSL